MHKRTYISKSPEDTLRIAAEVLGSYRGRVVFALSGNLGSGKTVFTQGIALALGSRRTVTSPTFTLLNEYPGTRPLYHADLYRIDKPAEADSLDLEDYMEAQAVTAVEWPEKAPHLLPPDTVHVTLEIKGDTEERLITVTSP